MGLKPVLKIEPPADRRAAQRETHRVRRAARAQGDAQSASRSSRAIRDRDLPRKEKGITEFIQQS